MKFVRHIILVSLIVTHATTIHSLQYFSLLYDYSYNSYNKLPNIQKINYSITILYYTIIILQNIKPQWFPALRRGLIDPKQTRVPLSKINAAAQRLDPIVFKQWVMLDNIINRFSKITEKNDPEISQYQDLMNEHKQNVDKATEKTLLQTSANDLTTIRYALSFFDRYVDKNSNNPINYKPHFAQSQYAYFLQGPPGCGKTSFPYYLAHTYKIPLFNIEPMHLTTDHTGSACVNFKNIIEAAYAAASNVKNRVGLVLMNDVDRYFASNSNSSENASLMVTILDYIDTLQQKNLDLRDREQFKRKAEIIFFFTANYNKNADLTALTRTGRFICIDFMKERRTEKFSPTFAFNKVSSETKNPKDLPIHSVIKSLYKSSHFNKQVIEKSIKKCNANLPDTYKKAYDENSSKTVADRLNKKNKFKTFKLIHDEKDNDIIKIVHRTNQYEDANIKRCIELFSPLEWQELYCHQIDPETYIPLALGYIDQKILAAY